MVKFKKAILWDFSGHKGASYALQIPPCPTVISLPR